MFRKPRDDASSNSETPIKPSTGRPPTPPNAGVAKSIPERVSSHTSSTKHLTPRSSSKANVPTLGRQGTKQFARGKTPSKPNASILNFFKKVENPNIDDGGLFIADGNQEIEFKSYRDRSPGLLSTNGTSDICGDEEEGARYNESISSVKRRKTGDISPHFAGGEADPLTRNTSDSTADIGAGGSPSPLETSSTARSKPRRIGGFVDDSDSEEEGADAQKTLPVKFESKAIQSAVKGAESIELQDIVTNDVGDIHDDEQKHVTETIPAVQDTKRVLSVDTEDEHNMTDSAERLNRHERRKLPRDRSGHASPTPPVPSLKQEETSYADFADFDDLQDFEDEEYADGEEFLERKWMEEQARLEAAEIGNGDLGETKDLPFNNSSGSDEMVEACPICNSKLGHITPEQASQHVNACLDGNPISLPKPVIKSELSDEVKYMPPGAGVRFSRAAIARPGQANPFDLDEAGKVPSSAFSKLMSSKAEDAAWANAAAAEHAARGKPAYQRTCPFYKIMPGFFICVDAFRYGAVQGCKAYFLSHFHSDHYVGLTSSWCHGPIYCSKVTANLVKQQLRVDPKWVVALEFENKFEVPGTQGVGVTMIPANHCPGSSLFLFEKVIGKGDRPKIQRVLHCGDFRACPEHIAHPLLMPDVVDSITGRTKQQKIDVCYLDTTYLNPRYAFPSQGDVIKACADMCVSLSKDRADENDAWELVKKERAGAGMAKFINGTPSVQPEDESIAMSTSPSKKPRGRLLVICGTYSIGKERICLGIARALDCKIWAPPGKQRICAALEDPELMSRMTNDPREAQIHMQMLMEIRAETLQDYLNGYKPHFSRIVGFRPSGWNYRPPNSRYAHIPRYLRYGCC